MQDAISIVRLSPGSDHVGTVAAWTHAEWGRQLHPERTLAEAVAIFRSECGDGGVPSVFVAFQGDIPVGTASLIAEDMAVRQELTPWLASVFVLPEWRGRGIASALVRRVEEEASAHGIARCYLFTPDQQALYRRAGWLERESLTYCGEVVTIMARDLPRTGARAVASS